MTGVLLLHVRAAKDLVKQALSLASSKVIEVLYVIPHGCFVSSADNNEKETRTSISRFMTSVYSTASNQHPGLDIRVLLNLAENMTSQQLKNHPDLIITDRNTEDLAKRLVESDRDVPVTHLETKGDSDMIRGSLTSFFPVFGNVVVGGTFDRLHTGHKYLLSSALLQCNHRLLVGISDGPLLSGKSLEELIEPYGFRANAVVDFANEVCPDVKCDVVPIFEPLGPTATDDTLDCLVVSLETASGGEKVNQVREANGLRPLELLVVELMATPQSEEANQKLSSSLLRKQSLGHLRCPESDDLYVSPWLRSRALPVEDLADVTSLKPYVIGLTGGIASGKSSIAKRMAAEGAAIVDCDKLGHEAYLPRTKAYLQVVEAFGSDVLYEDGHINRKALGAIVFNDKAKLQQLCSIVWPEIARLAELAIQHHCSEGKTICVLDAAVLLEAGWDCYVHEVWVSIIPRDETIRRVMKRDGVSEEEVTRRLESQLSNVERIKRADVILSSLWEPEETQRQVLVGMSELQSRVASFHSHLARL